MPNKPLTLLLSVVLLFSCKNNTSEKTVKQKTIDSEQLMEMNRYLVEKDNELISAYVERRNWDMQVTGSGLRYMVYEKGNGEKAEKGKYATIKYSIELLDGTLCYTSDSTGLKKFLIGKGNTESGLEEGILYLREGDKARFVMPPHLAYHLLGDEKKVPPRSVIVYFIELLKITND